MTKSLIVTRGSPLDAVDVRQGIVTSLRASGHGHVVPFLDPAYGGLEGPDLYAVLAERYRRQLVHDGLSTGHFQLDSAGELRVTIAVSVDVLLGYVFEAYTVRACNDAAREFGRAVFKWITERQRLSTAVFEPFVAVGIAFPETATTYPGFHNPTLKQYDVTFLRLNPKRDEAEPATIMNSTIPAGLQVKAIRQGEAEQIVQPLLDGKYRRVLTWLRHRDGRHSYESCMEEISRRARRGQIPFEQAEKVRAMIAWPEQFGLDQREVDHYTTYLEAWHSHQAKADALILKGLELYGGTELHGSAGIVTL